MILAKVSLLVWALILGGFGIWYVVDVARAAMATQIPLPAPTARIDFRAMYGGLNVGLGVFLWIASQHPEMFRTGLLLQVLMLGGLALSRAVGIVLEGGAERLIWIILAVEAAGFAMAWIAMRRLPAGL
jgi:hypothetical protein